MLGIGRYGLLAFQLVGFLASAYLATVTFLDRSQVEQRLQSFAIAKVEVAANEAWIKASDAAQDSSRAARLGALAKRFGLEAEEIDQKRQEVISALVAHVVSGKCVENCGLTVMTGLAVHLEMRQQVAKLRIGQRTLGEFIAERYETTVRGLLLDLRRFSLVNTVTLALMMGLILFKNALNWRFAAFSFGVTAYAAWATYGYIYTQDWARTILLQNWAATGYQAAMVFVCLLLFDWLFLNGKLTQMTMNAIGNIISILPMS